MPGSPEFPQNVESDATDRANGRPTRVRSERIQSAILIAAMVEFANRGLHGGRIARIAQRANVTRATVYKHFDSKEAILEKLSATCAQRVRSTLAQAIDSEQAPAAVLRAVALCLYRCSILADSKAISRIVVAESERLPAVARRSRECRSLALEPLSEYFEKLSMNGQLTLEDPPRAAMQFAHLVTSALEPLFGDELTAEQGPETWINSAVDVFLRGALCPGAAGHDDMSSR